MLHIPTSLRKEARISSSTCTPGRGSPAAAGCAGLLSPSDPHRAASSSPHRTAAGDCVPSPAVCSSSSGYPCPPSAGTGRSTADCAACCQGTQKTLLEANLQGQSPGVINYKHEFPTKKAGQTNSVLCVFQAPGKRAKPETKRGLSVKKKIHRHAQHPSSEEMMDLRHLPMPFHSH